MGEVFPLPPGALAFSAPFAGRLICIGTTMPRPLLLYGICLPLSFLLGACLVVAPYFLLASPEKPSENTVIISLDERIAALPTYTNSSQPASSPEPILPRPTPMTTLGLREIVATQKHSGYKLPGLPSAVGYGPKTGVICIAHQDKHLLFYQLDDLGNGLLDPKVLDIQGEVTTICSKEFKGREYFIIGFLNRPLLALINADDPISFQEIELDGPIGVRELASSRKTDDPALYLITSPSPESSRSGWFKCLASVNLETHRLTKVFCGECRGLLVKAQGDEVWVTESLGAHRLSWHTVLSNGVKLGFQSVTEPYQVADRTFDLDPHFNTGRPVDFSPHYANKHELFWQLKGLNVNPVACSYARPFFACWQGRSVATYSLDNFQFLESFELNPATRQPTAEESWAMRNAVDNARNNSPHASPKNNRASLITIDDQRNRLIAIAIDQCYVCDIAHSAKPRAVEQFDTSHPWTSMITVGESMEFEFPKLDATSEIEVSIDSNYFGASNEGGKWSDTESIPTQWNDQPSITDGRFYWKPSRAQLGRNYLRFKLTHKDKVHQWVRFAQVSSRSALVPFHVAGIGKCVDSKYAVIWGPDQILVSYDSFSSGDRLAIQSMDSPIPIDSRTTIALIDTQSLQLQKQLSVPGQIESAFGVGDHVYISRTIPDIVDQKIGPRGGVASSAFTGTNSIKDYHRTGEIRRTPPGPGEIARFEWSSGDFVKLCSTERFASSFDLVADRFLVPHFHAELSLSEVGPRYLFPLNLNLNDEREDIVIDCKGPNLVDRNQSGFHLRRSFSSLGSKYLIDNIAYDGVSGEPTLLCRAPARQTKDSFLSLVRRRGFCFIDHGPHLLRAIHDEESMYSDAYPVDVTSRLPDSTRYLLRRHPGIVICDLANPSRRNTGQSLQIFPYVPTDGSSNVFAPVPDSLVVAGGSVLAAKFGVLFKIDLSELPPDPPDSLLFEHRQASFQLPFDKPATLRYSAKGAARYTLELGMFNERFHRRMSSEGTARTYESLSGDFEVKFSDTPEVMDAVIKVVQGTGFDEMDDLERSKFVQDFANSVAPIKLKPITGFPLFVQALVLAEDEQGKRVSVLSHWYVVDVPLAGLKKL